MSGVVDINYNIRDSTENQNVAVVVVGVQESGVLFVTKAKKGDTEINLIIMWRSAPHRTSRDRHGNKKLAAACKFAKLI